MNSALGGLLILLIQFSVAPCLAALGDQESGVVKESVAMQAAHLRIQKAKYSVHEISTPVGIIREYASNDGQVFAVTWRGMKRPDLSILLGNYHAEYAAAAARIPRAHGRQATTVRSEHAIVQRGGHMRDIHGRAYLPARMPASVKIEELE